MIKLELDSVVESICEKGCQSVNNDIKKLQQKEFFHEVIGLSNKDKEVILHELLSIMQVYELEAKK